MEWIRWWEVPESALVSVITATRDRAGLLRRAIRSVQRQTYRNWELIVVDDGSDDDTRAVVASSRDDRVRGMSVERLGVAAARNHGLAAARGSLVTYLDDDNVMHPEWLRSIAWAFDRWTDVDVLYAARIIEDSKPAYEIEHEMPSVVFQPFDREFIEKTNNIIDTNVLAHRAHLDEARFDPEFSACADWDLAQRLTAERAPLELPVIAVLYATSAPDRLMASPEAWEEWDRIRGRARA